MTQEQEQTPGPELDRRVAEKMGYPVALGPDKKTHGVYYKVEDHKPYFVGVPGFSTDIELAWRVVEYVTKAHFKTFFTLSYNPAYRKPYLFEFELIKDKISGQKFRGEADTAPLGIVLAFLALPDLGEVKE